MQRSPEVDVMVRALFARLLSGGKLYCDPQDAEDVIQEGIIGGLEAAEKWSPDHGAFSTFILTSAHGYMLNYLNREENGGVGGKDQNPLARYGELDTTDIDALTNTPEGIGERLTYVDPPEGFADPAVEADRASIINRLAKLPPKEAAVIQMLYGIGVKQQTVRDVAELWGCGIGTVHRLSQSALSALGFRETAAPTGWAAYRESAFAKGAGATKAAWPTCVKAGRPIRAGHNNLFVEEEITPAERKSQADVRRRAIL